MTRSLYPRILAMFLAAAAVPVQAEQLVREFSGSRSMDTAEFEVEAPWVADWRVNSDFPSSMGIAIVLVEAGCHNQVARQRCAADGYERQLSFQGGRRGGQLDHQGFPAD